MEKNTVNSQITEQQKLDAACTLLPPPGEEALCDSQVCLFCKTEQPNARTCFAAADFGHVLSEQDPQWLGKGKKGQRGVVFTAEAACCDSCRKKMRLVRLVLPLCIALGMAVGLLFGLVLNLHNMLARIHMAMPLLLYVLCVLLAVAVGATLRRTLTRRYETTCRMNLTKIDYVKRMQQAGWEPLHMVGGVPDMAFSTERLKKNWLV